MCKQEMNQNIIWLILDSFYSPVLPKVFEGIKNDYFVLLWVFGAKNPEQLQIK